MRGINSELERRLRLLQQTEYNNADPRASVVISRPTSALTDSRYLDRMLVGTFPGLTASSIAICRPRRNGSVDRVYIGYVANGTGHVKFAKSSPNMRKHVWQSGGFSAPAIDIAVAFDGTMPGKTIGAEFVTDEKPWVFWVTPDGALKGKILGLLGDVTLAASNCTKVTAIRATWGGQGGVDFGLCVFFLLGGALYYRQLIGNEWMDAEVVQMLSGLTFTDIAAFRTWDYRVGVQAKATNGKVYELFTQYQGFARHGSEHLEVKSAASAGSLVGIRYLDAAEKEHIEIAAIAAPVLYGGLYATGAPRLVSAYNSDGRGAAFEFDRHLVAEEVAVQPQAFSIVDSNGRVFVPYSTSLSQTGRVVFAQFHGYDDAVGECQAIYTPGTVHSMAGDLLVRTAVSWTPVNLNPSHVPAPEVLSITNI